MSWSTIIGDVILATASIIVGVIGRRNRKTARELNATRERLDVLTDVELDRRIHRLLIDVMATQEGERMRRFLHNLMRSHEDESEGVYPHGQ